MHDHPPIAPATVAALAADAYAGSDADPTMWAGAPDGARETQWVDHSGGASWRIWLFCVVDGYVEARNEDGDGYAAYLADGEWEAI